MYEVVGLIRNSGRKLLLKIFKLGMVAHAYLFQHSGWLRQEDCKFEISLGNTAVENLSQ